MSATCSEVVACYGLLSSHNHTRRGNVREMPWTTVCCFVKGCSTQYKMGLIKTDYNFYIINNFYTRACRMKHSSGSTKQIFLSQLEASSPLHLWPVTQLQTNINLCPLIQMDKRKIKSLINHTSEEQNL